MQTDTYKYLTRHRALLADNRVQRVSVAKVWPHPPQLKELVQ